MGRRSLGTLCGSCDIRRNLLKISRNVCAHNEPFNQDISVERRTLAQIQRHLKGNRQKKWSTIGQQHLPRLWLFTDPVKMPNLTTALDTLPRRCGIGVVIRARSREQEIAWIRIVKRAMATRGITGYLVRWSQWRQGYYSGQLGWHVTTKSPPLTVSTIK